MNEKNYYEEIIQEIKRIKESDLDQAVLLLKKELSMPYIPKEYQKEMEELFKEYSSEFDSKKITMNREEMLEIILSGKVDGKLSLALTQISQFNWVSYESTIQKIFDSTIVTNNAKTIFMETLIAQKLNYDFKLSGSKTVNPSKQKSVFDSEYCIKNVMGIESSDISDLVVKRVAMESFLIYISTLFPQNLSLKYVDHVNELIFVGKALLGDKTEMENNKVSTKIFETISKN